MSAKLGNCARCGKSVYQLEGVTAVKKCYHKSCFKCKTCGWQLTLTNYKAYDDEIYCSHHFPVTGFGENHQHGKVDVDSKHIEAQYNAPKMDVVNHQVRGEAAGQQTQIGTDSFAIAKSMSAPKLNTVNQQVRGEAAGQKTGVTMDAIHIAKPTTAPHLDTVNPQIRGEAGKQSNIGLDSIAMSKPLAAPKLDVVGGVHRGGDNRDTN
eukprot:Phypoly_transcript_06395.p1 GENE.Phypoly_transcript_06395~~Phypoly_transcript_06395.p1  ORF type:complete len:208 (-),score=33.82 Phypoly_transcript_06395:942-1565(-)